MNLPRRYFFKGHFGRADPVLGRMRGRLDDPLKFLQQLFALIPLEFDIASILRDINISF